MLDVKPFDKFSHNRQKKPALWKEGTLHHIFDGGWIWIIPFNNHKTSKNRLTSVGLQLDIDKYPNTTLSPEDEFRKIIGNFPSIKKQLEN